MADVQLIGGLQREPPPDAQIDWFKANRDPSRIYAKFHEALRRNKVLHMSVIETAPVLRDHVTLDTLRTVYDMDGMMGRLMRQDTWEALGRAEDRGWELAEAGMLIPDKVAYLWAELTAPDQKIGIPWLWTERVVALDAAQFHDSTEDLWVAHVFEHDTNMQTRQPATYQGREWMCRRLLFGRNGWLIEDGDDQWDNVREAGLSQVDQDLYSHHTSAIMACCGIVATTPTLAEAPSHSDFADMNRGRGRGRLAAVLPVQRVLDINRKIYPKRMSEPTGREMPLHYRRGGLRTYRSDRYVNMKGKTGKFASAIVRADKDDGDAVMPIYDVVGKLEK